LLPILAFDTSAAHCAAALLWDGGLILRDEAMDKGQAERLIPLLEEVLAEAGLGWRDLKAIAVGTGPGNFTGVRIAVAAARGLALGLGIPAVGVTRLEALAFGLPRPVTVIEDARRGEVYVQVFNPDGPEPARIGWRRPGAGTGTAAGRGYRPDRCRTRKATAAAPGALLPAWRGCSPTVGPAAGDPAMIRVTFQSDRRPDRSHR
jgi:tRNA threonylcarbamoyl adenosine modification protein YeaZ